MERFDTQKSEDLLARAREVIPGGVLVIMAPRLDAQGQNGFLGVTALIFGISMTTSTSTICVRTAQ